MTSQALPGREAGAATPRRHDLIPLEDGQQYTRQNLALFERFGIRAAMPMHARAGDPRYMEFKKVFEAKIAGLPIHVPMKMGERFTYLDGRVQK